MHTSQRGYTMIELLLVLGLMGVVCAMVIPITSSSLKGNRLRGDANAIKNFVGLAKMRASSQSTRARVYADLGANSYALEVWDRTTNAWINGSGTRRLAAGVTFGFGALATPPPNTQVTIALSPACTPGLTAAGAVANTACITFNSRGLPVDADGKLFAKHALYLNGDLGVFATTVTQTPLIRLWSSPITTALWTLK
jgi:prepilin-type N-terminal cleavage/methylation domain-containing protein